MSDELARNPENEDPAAALNGALDLARTFEIERAGGTSRAKAEHFPALAGWEIRRQYREFLESKEPNFRREFTLNVLYYALIVADDGTETRISGENAVNELLEKWQNVEKVFNAVLGYNGIKTDAAEAERRRWQVAGEDMAASFLAAVSSTIGPALTLASSKKADR